MYCLSQGSCSIWGRSLQESSTPIFCKQLVSRAPMKTRDVVPALCQCWAAVADGGPALPQRRDSMEQYVWIKRTRDLGTSAVWRPRGAGFTSVLLVTPVWRDLITTLCCALTHSPHNVITAILAGISSGQLYFTYYQRWDIVPEQSNILWWRHFM